MSAKVWLVGAGPGDPELLTLKAVRALKQAQIVMINGDSPKVDAAVTMFSHYEIIETVRTGKVVMARGEQPT